MKRKTILVVLFIIALVFSASVISAQPPPPPPQDIPIDGGLLFLIGAGMAYGAKEIYKYERKKKDKKH